MAQALILHRVAVLGKSYKGIQDTNAVAHEGTAGPGDCCMKLRYICIWS